MLKKPTSEISELLGESCVIAFKVHGFLVCPSDSRHWTMTSRSPPSLPWVLVVGLSLEEASSPLIIWRMLNPPLLRFKGLYNRQININHFYLFLELQLKNQYNNDLLSNLLIIWKVVNLDLQSKNFMSIKMFELKDGWREFAFHLWESLINCTIQYCFWIRFWSFQLGWFSMQPSPWICFLIFRWIFRAIHIDNIFSHFLPLQNA